MRSRFEISQKLFGDGFFVNGAFVLAHGVGEGRIPRAGKCGGVGKAVSFWGGKIVGGTHAPGASGRVVGKYAAGDGQAASVKIGVVVQARAGGVELSEEDFGGRGVLAVHADERGAARAEAVGGKGHDGGVFADVDVAIGEGCVFRERMAQEESQGDGQWLGVVAGLGEDAEEGRRQL